MKTRRNSKSHYLAFLWVLALYQSVTIIRASYGKSYSEMKAQYQAELPSPIIIHPSKPSRKISTYGQRQQPALESSSSHFLQRETLVLPKENRNVLDEKTNNNKESPKKTATTGGADKKRGTLVESRQTHQESLVEERLTTSTNYSSSPSSPLVETLSVPSPGKNEMAVPRKIVLVHQVPNTTIGNETTVSTPIPAKIRKNPFRPAINCPKPHPLLEYIEVAPPPANPPKILCFLMTTSEYHKLRLAGVTRTWGRKCDKLLILSDMEDRHYGTVRLESKASYKGLWNKLNETVHYLHEPLVENNGTAYIDQYDWFLKADDDSYLIMENLQAFLTQPEIQQKNLAGEPLIYGRRYSWCHAEQLRSGMRPFKAYFNSTFSTPQNQRFEKDFYQKFHDNPPVLYNHGGAGYVMNQSYMREFLKALDSPNSLSGMVDEDLANGATMAYHGIFPQPTVDAEGGQYFHPEPHSHMYSSPPALLRNMVGNDIPSEVVRNGTDCCARNTISFHHISKGMMLSYERLFYQCREQTSG
jgi:glycoprotein-N-acetylgalactosamine 3-beta-galactosyltransferase